MACFRDHSPITNRQKPSNTQPRSSRWRATPAALARVFWVRLADFLIDIEMQSHRRKLRLASNGRRVAGDWFVRQQLRGPSQVERPVFD